MITLADGQPWQLLTSFPDGRTVHAIPAVDEDAYERIHDLVHSLVAAARDRLGAASDVIWLAAQGRPLNLDVVRRSETATIAVGAALRAIDDACAALRVLDIIDR